jgi:hypothetical protein
MGGGNMLGMEVLTVYDFFRQQTIRLRALWSLK